MRRFRLTLTGAARRGWALIGWRTLVVLWCRRLRIEGRGNVPDRAVVVVANHASHADTVLLQFALATCHHRPVLVAGAEDYWFRNGVLTVLARLLGVFAFPRKGDAGVERAQQALASEATVIMFPQGSRSGGRFRTGIGRIAMNAGVQVVPVRLEGPSDLLPKGRRWPRRTDVVVRFGEPTSIRADETASAFADRLERIVVDELGDAA